MTEALRTLSGGCHCGANRYLLHWPRADGALPARRCGCSFCTRIGGVWTSDPGAELVISCSAGLPPLRYRFGTETAEFLVCSRCGITFAALDGNSGAARAVVNVNTLDPRDDLALDHSDSDFEGETTAARLQRRARRWIGKVRIETR